MTQSDTSSRLSQTHETREDARFLEQLREEKDWGIPQRSVVKDGTSYGKIVSRFIGKSSFIDENHTSEESVEENSLVAIGARFAQLTKKSLEAAKTQKLFSSFQFLVLLSYCIYLQKEGISKDDVHRIMEKFFKHDERRRRRLLLRAAKINSTIRKIAGVRNWTIYRATELFFIYALLPSQMLKIRDATFDAIPEKLSDAKYDFSRCLTTSYTIPGLVMMLLKNAGYVRNNLFNDICTTLGYDQNLISKPLDQIYCIEAAMNAPLPIVTSISFMQPLLDIRPKGNGPDPTPHPLTTRSGQPTLEIGAYNSRQSRKRRRPSENATNEAPSNALPMGTMIAQAEEQLVPFVTGNRVSSEKLSNTCIRRRTRSPRRRRIDTGNNSDANIPSDKIFQQENRSLQSLKIPSVNVTNSSINRVTHIQKNCPTNIVETLQLNKEGQQIITLQTSRMTTASGPTSLINNMFNITGPNSEDLPPPWTKCATDGKLNLVFQWPLPNSTDKLQIYDWGALDALKVMLPSTSAQTEKPIERLKSDQIYDYYYIPAEQVNFPCLPQASLVEAIHRSRQWQEELNRRKVSAAQCFETTECVTIGLQKKSLAGMARRCILCAIVDGLQQT